ncbi:GNAT family N-acetyltransferase [bacterium AH-315-F18]|nr:GNAT family N-acetyltransferase [bacterium AH-315-F18]
MSPAIDIAELTTDEEFREAFEVMSELRKHLSREDYQELLRDMRPSGYRLLGVRAGGELTALAGFVEQTCFYYGRHIWVYDLIVKEGARSRGHGKALLDFLHRDAAGRGLSVVALSTGLQNNRAQKFYESDAGMTKASFVYKNVLDAGIGVQP